MAEPYKKFTKGGVDYYRFGDYDIEADKARVMRTERRIIGGGDAGDSREETYEVEDELGTLERLSKIADQRYYAAQSAKTLNLTTGGQSGYKGGNVSRIGSSTRSGGRYVGSRSLLRGKTGAAVLGGI